MPRHEVQRYRGGPLGVAGAAAAAAYRNRGAIRSAYNLAKGVGKALKGGPKRSSNFPNLPTPPRKSPPRTKKKVTFTPKEAAVSAGIGGTECSMKIRIPGGTHGTKDGPKGTKGFAGVVRYQQNHTGTISGYAGQQVNNEFLMIMTKDQLYTTTGAAYSASPKGELNYAALNNAFPGVTTTAGSGPFASTAGAAIAAFVPKTRKFLISNISVNLDLASFSTGAVTMTIFAITPRINQMNTFTGSAQWLLGVAAQADGVGIPGIANNPTAINTAVLGYPSPAIIGVSNPRNSPGFNKYYKILAARKVVMPQATLCNLQFNFGGNHVIDNEKLATYNSQGITYIANKTVQFMYIIHGQLGWDSLKTAATYTKPQIAYSATVKYTMKPMKDFQARAPQLEAVVNSIVYDATDSNVKIGNSDTDTFIAAAVQF